jgi:glutaredoxin 3
MNKEQSSKVQVYLIQGCPFCIATSQLLGELSIEHEVIDLSDRLDRRDVVNAILPGHTSVPLVLIDGKPIGGNSELQALHASGKLMDQVFA